MNSLPEGVEVLVVDDDAALCSMMQRTLSEKGLSVCMCANSHSAMEKLATDSFNIIFTDIYMPGISGIEFAAYCREKYPSMAIVTMTGAPSLSNLNQAKKIGVIYYLPKPFSDAQIDETLRLAITWNMGKLIDRASRRYLAITGSGDVQNPGRQLQVKVAIKEFFNHTLNAGDIRRFVYDADVTKNPLYAYLHTTKLS